MAMEHPVLVIGAGLAGLSLARVLHHKNIPVQIFESTTREKTEGYGISLRSWAYSPLLTELGISEEELRKLAATDAATGGRGHIEGIMYDAVSGKTLMKAPASQTGSPAGDVFRANRNRLRHFLMQGLDVAFDHTLETLEINEEERFITARFANGVCVKGCMLVGADGVHSTVRKILLPAIKPAVIPALVYNGERQIPRSEFDATIAPYMVNNNVLLGVAENSNIGITITDVADASVMLSWTYSGLLSHENSHHSTAQGLAPEILKELASLGPLAPPFSLVLQADKVEKDRLYHWPMRIVRVSDEDLEALAIKGVVLIGDSAHAMPIFAGEGGNQALVDAVELGAKLIESFSVEGVAAFYEAAALRWKNAVSGSEKRFSSLNRPLKEWRMLAEKVAAS